MLMKRETLLDLLDDVQKRYSAEEVAEYYADNVDPNVDFMFLLKVLENFEALVSNAYSYGDEFDYECVSCVADAYDDVIAECLEHGEFLEE